MATNLAGGLDAWMPQIRSKTAIRASKKHLFVDPSIGLAALGIEDFYNDKFQEYNNVLFDFQQVRQEMTFLQEKSPYRGKINIRKFIEGLLFLSQN